MQFCGAARIATVQKWSPTIDYLPILQRKVFSGIIGRNAIPRMPLADIFLRLHCVRRPGRKVTRSRHHLRSTAAPGFKFAGLEQVPASWSPDDKTR